jgi:hypothetical protein
VTTPQTPLNSSPITYYDLAHALSEALQPLRDDIRELKEELAQQYTREVIDEKLTVLKDRIQSLEDEREQAEENAMNAPTRMLMIVGACIGCATGIISLIVSWTSHITIH